MRSNYKIGQQSIQSSIFKFKLGAKLKIALISLLKKEGFYEKDLVKDGVLEEIIWVIRW
jgi:hypothetical protein